MELLRNSTRKAKYALGAGLAGLALTGCGAQLEKDLPGTIVAHEYDDRDVVSVKPIIIDPESWYIDIRQCQRSAEEEADSDGCIVFQHEVSEDYYNATHDGQELSAEEINALID